VEQRAYTNDTDYKDEWYFETNNSFGVIYLYDEVFGVRENDAADLIRFCHAAAAERFSSIFNITVISTVNSYTSICDDCKKELYNEISTNTMDSPCNHLPNCLSTLALREQLISDVGSGNNKNSIVLFTGSRMLYDSGDRSNSDPSSHTVIMTPMSTWPWDDDTNSYSPLAEDDRKQEYIFLLLHELSHQLGAPDHYCYGTSDPNETCLNPNCDKCYTGVNNRICLMKSVDDVKDYSGADIYCADCYNIISEHISDHH
jgi:hypothetical protein